MTLKCVTIGSIILFSRIKTNWFCLLIYSTPNFISHKLVMTSIWVIYAHLERTRATENFILYYVHPTTLQIYSYFFMWFSVQRYWLYIGWILAWCLFNILSTYQFSKEAHTIKTCDSSCQITCFLFSLLIFYSDAKYFILPSRIMYYLLSLMLYYLQLDILL